ncbi:MAG: lysophospholipid acyltransferase family protein [Acidobacteriota bacterium]|nr:lysophospholipid acyltransferase family protein [Acidobacteriota bacterium]
MANDPGKKRGGLGLILLTSAFGSGYILATIGLIFGVLPILLLMDGAWDPVRFRRAVRRFIQFYGRMSIRLAWPIVRFRIVDRDKVRGVEPCVYAMNHYSFTDVFFCGFLPADQTIIAIRSWPFRLPVFNIFMRWAGYLDVESLTCADFLRESGRTLASGASLLFFPEGHRSRTGRLQPLGKGAFLIAARNRVPVVPVTIEGTQFLGGYRSRFLCPSRVTLTFHPPVIPSGADVQSVRSLRRRVEKIFRESLDEA